MSKHIKTDKPTDADLKGNPVIGGSKGVIMGQASPEDLEDTLGENTVEGDLANDANPQGGIRKDESPSRK
jgi:hypothetical protein